MTGPVGQLLHPSDWDWGSVPDWLVLLTAVIGAWLALRQLARTAISQRDYLRSEQGSQLMQIDDKYESVLQESRKANLALFERARAKVGAAASADQVAAAVSAELGQLVAKRAKIGDADPLVSDMAVKALDQYFLLMQLPTYIETVGVLVEYQLVNADSVLKLYDAMIDRCIGNVLPHIEERRRQNDNPAFLIYAQRLYDRAHSRMANDRVEAERIRLAAAANS